MTDELKRSASALGGSLAGDGRVRLREWDRQFGYMGLCSCGRACFRDEAVSVDNLASLTVPANPERAISGRFRALRAFQTCGSAVGHGFAITPQPVLPLASDDMAPTMFLDAVLRSTGNPLERWCPERRLPSCSPHSNYNNLVTLLRHGKLKEFYEALAEEGSSCSAANAYGHTLLHCAARMGNVEVARTLIEGGADPSLADESGKTALHDACWAVEFNSAMLELLGDRNPRVFCAIDRFGATPLGYCHPGTHAECRRFIAAVQPRWWAAACPQRVICESCYISGCTVEVIGAGASTESDSGSDDDDAQDDADNDADCAELAAILLRVSSYACTVPEGAPKAKKQRR